MTTVYSTLQTDHDPPGPAANVGLAPAGRRALDETLFYMIGWTLPFPVIGIPINVAYTLSLTSLLGIVLASRRLLRDGWQPLHRAALLMLLVFTGTAAWRFPVTSFALSLSALAFALSPLTNLEVHWRELRALIRGLLGGFWMTVGLILLTILSQLIGLERSLGPISTLLVGDEQTGRFLGYIRPYAGFSEPSHLAIYLVGVFVCVDILSRAGWRMGSRKIVVAFATLLTGSVSGLLMLALYLLGRLFGVLGRIITGRMSKTFVPRALVGLGVAIGAFLVVGPSPADLADEYTLRLIQMLDDMETANLVGSEGSRVNAVLALPEYWESTGTLGFLLGTGYANHEAWLIDTYGHLNENATFARGAVDSIVIAVFLSTGLVGLIAYVGFLYRVLSWPIVKAYPTIVLFLLALNLSYGYLISGLYWQVILVVAVIARATWSQRPQWLQMRRASKQRARTSGKPS